MRVLALFIAVVALLTLANTMGNDETNRKYLHLEINVPLVPLWFSNFNVHKNHLGEYMKAVSWA